MSTMTNSGRVPEFTLGWRMRLALESADMSVQQMADQLGYSRSTISRWLNGLDEPRAAVKAQWSLLTGVDRDWLDHGQADPTPPTPPGREDPAREARLARLADQKRSRSRGARTTLRYLAPAFAAA